MNVSDLIFIRDLVQRFFEPLARATKSPDQAGALLVQLGYKPPGPVTAFADLRGTIAAIDSLVAAIEELPEDPDAEAISGVALRTLPAIAAIIVEVNRFSTSIQSNFAGSPILTQTDIASAISQKLLDYLVVRLLENYYRTAGTTLAMLGFIEAEQVDLSASPFEAAYLRRTVRWDRLTKLFSSPIELLRDNLTSGDEVLVFRILQFLGQLGRSLGLQTSFQSPNESVLSQFNDGSDLFSREDSDELTTLYVPLIVDEPIADLALELYPVRDVATGKFTGIAAALSLGSTLEIPLGDRLRMLLKFSANVAEGLGVRLSRTGEFRFTGSLFSGSPAELTESVQFGALIAIERTRETASEKLLSVGLPGGFLFEIDSGTLALGVEKQAKVRVFIETELHGGRLVMKSDDADGFIAQLLPAEGIKAEFDLGLGISNDAGLYFKGTSGLEIRLPLHLALGPIEINYLTLGAKFDNSAIPVTAATGISANLGPIAAVVEDVGVQATFVIKSDRSGNLGPLDVSFGFKPPKGVGLSIDAAVVKGGGYLYFDFDKQEYAGVLELAIAELVTVKAIGLITTRMPDNSPGFSLLVIITAEFSGIQLGFGFTLTGVGGLLGLNRTMLPEPIAAGIRSGGINSIMFPPNPVENAPKIISDLRNYFPPSQDRFLIGPMVKIGWGTPTLVTLAFGLIIEIPGNIAIIGVLRVNLPAEDAPIVVINVGFIGALQFDKQRLWFYASMFDSRILFLTLSGDMGLLMDYSENSNFVLSVGGFHPLFSPPPLPFPNPSRIHIDVLNKASQRISVEAYFAVTSNTVQFGSRADLYFGLAVVSVSGYFAFDALFQFSPFKFIIQMSFAVSLDVFGTGLFSIQLKLMLEGPTPWHAKGIGKLTIDLWLFELSVSADFDVTWGDAQNTTLPPIAVVPLLKQEFEKVDNWRAELPAAGHLLVSLRQLEEQSEEQSKKLVLHPLGSLQIAQRAVPLNLNLDKVGNRATSDGRNFSVAISSAGLSETGKSPQEKFAIAQYQEFSKDEKLTRPAFQKFDAGVELSVSGRQLGSAKAVRRTVRYETIIVDSNFKRFVIRFFPFVGTLFTHFLSGAAVKKSKLSWAYKKSMVPFDKEERIQVRESRYVVASVATNKSIAEGVFFANEAMARDYMLSHLGKNPHDAGEVHVIPAFEEAA